MENSINILYDHYKETCELQRNNLKTRNSLFVIVIIILGLLLLLSYSPNTVGEIILSFLNNKYGIHAEIQFGILQSLIWVVLLYTSIRYYQSTIGIERNYKYIHKVEERLSNLLFNNDNENSSIVIDREGKSYLENYPKCSDAIDIIYKWVFPVIYIIAVIFKIVVERRCELTYVFDIVIFTFTIVLCFLYMVFNWQIIKTYHS